MIASRLITFVVVALTGIPIEVVSVFSFVSIVFLLNNVYTRMLSDVTVVAFLLSTVVTVVVTVTVGMIVVKDAEDVPHFLFSTVRVVVIGVAGIVMLTVSVIVTEQ